MNFKNFINQFKTFTQDVIIIHCVICIWRMLDGVIKHIVIDGVGIDKNKKVLVPFQHLIYFCNKIDYYITPSKTMCLITVSYICHIHMKKCIIMTS
jgi:hypothetical protein